eukprot:4814642-Pyramimonas_sp.AAC.1
MTKPLPEIILDDVIHFLSYCLRNVTADTLSSHIEHKQARIWCIEFIFKQMVEVPAYNERLQKKSNCVDGKLKFTVVGMLESILPRASYLDLGVFLPSYLH